VHSSRNKLLRRVLIELWVGLVTISAATPAKALEVASDGNETSFLERESTGSDQDASDQKDPPPLKPSRESSAQGARVSLLVGLNLFAWGGYTYDTRVTLAGAEQFEYTGKKGFLGGALFLDPALTLPGALRRITLGVSINSGGVGWRERSVIPAGLMTPFSQRNLVADIQSKALGGWHSAISPHIEHDVVFLGGSRVRAGYQYWRQIGSDAGAFRQCDNNCAMASYNVRLNLTSHLARISLNDYIDLDDSDNDPNRPDRRKRKAGMIRQLGVMIGTNRTVIIFVGIGAFLEVPR
jgi:hypothetical protein